MSRLASFRRLLLLLALVLLPVLVVLTSLAYATPPDPVWVSGFFDGDDNDEGVFLVTSITATLDPFPLSDCALFTLHRPRLLFDDRSPVSSQYFSTADARASPPA
jgi:hypothetical protein